MAPGLQAPYRVAPGLPRRPHRRSLALTRSTRHTVRRQRPSATRAGACLVPAPKRRTGWRLAPLFNQRAAPRSPTRAHFVSRCAERRGEDEEEEERKKRKRRKGRGGGGEKEEEKEEGGEEEEEKDKREGKKSNFFYRFNFVYI